MKKELKDKSTANIIKNTLGSKIISYHSSLARALKSVKAALFLQQCVYWTDKTRDPNGWFYKTIKDFEKETALTRHEQETAISILINYGLLEKKVKGIPPKRYFRVRMENLEKFLNEKLVKYDEMDSSQI